jgi:hypothetical protein
MKTIKLKLNCKFKFLQEEPLDIIANREIGIKLTTKTIKLVLSMTMPLRTNFKSRQVAKPVCICRSCKLTLKVFGVGINQCS